MKYLLLFFLLAVSSAKALTYSEWAATVWNSSELADPSISGSLAVNAAGVPNLVSYAFASGNPKNQTITSPKFLNASVVTETGTGAYQNKTGAQYYQVQYYPRQGVTDLRIRIELSNDLVHWVWGPESVRTIQTGTSVIVRSTRRVSGSQGAYNKWFARAKVGPVGKWYDDTLHATGSANLPQIPRPDFAIVANQQQRVISSGSTMYGITNGNKVVNRTLPSVLAVDYQIGFAPTNYYLGSFGNPEVTLSGSAGVWIPDNYTVRYVSSGTVSLQATTATISHSVDLTMSSISSGTTDTFVSWVAGSLGAQMDAAIDAALTASGTAGLPGSLAMFSSVSGTSTYTRNTSPWLSGTGIDYTGIGVWDNWGASDPSNPIQARAGTLISPRHFVYANHFSLPNGTHMRWVANDNTVITRTIVGQITLPYTTFAAADIRIGILDSDVPSSVCFYPIPPSNFKNYASDHWLSPVPIITTDQFKKVYVDEVTNFSDGFIWMSLPMITSASLRQPFSKIAIGGDSGSPCFFLINGRLVLAGYFYFATGIPDLSAEATAINAAMHSLSQGAGASTDYQLTTVELSSFTSY